MRRVVATLVIGVLAAAALSGCGPSSVSYNDGFAVGQSVAAAMGPGALHGAAALARCRQQWVVSGPASDNRTVWIRGCVAGIRRIQATIGLGTPVTPRWALRARGSPHHVA